jgi:hypothetical protein
MPVLKLNSPFLEQLILRSDMPDSVTNAYSIPALEGSIAPTHHALCLQGSSNEKREEIRESPLASPE